ncbi:MAG: hypothetical protein BA863_11195 [Desulfovibrio sp. S3730MH75]|nr:MAG: hypothetical protein BA863_11195 [Desulfovibrio sp. S3730MH75]
MYRFISPLVIIFLLTLSSVAVAQDEVHFASGSPLSSYQSRMTYPLLKEAFKLNGVEFDAKSYPSPRALLMSNSGTLDGELHRVYEFHEVSGGKYPNLVRIECQLMSAYIAVFSMNIDVEISDWNQLVGAKVGFVRGRKNMESFLGEVLRPGNVIPQSDELSLFKMLARGYIDYAISGSLDGRRFLIKHPGFSGIKEVGKLKEMKIYAYMHKKHAALAKKVAITLIEMKKDGSFQKMVNDARHSYCDIVDCKKVICTQDCFVSNVADKSKQPIRSGHSVQ